MQACARTGMCQRTSPILPSSKVDESRDKFTYGRPDLQLLRQFCLDKFGWPQDKADELLVPVLKVGILFPLLRFVPDPLTVHRRLMLTGPPPVLNCLAVLQH